MAESESTTRAAAIVLLSAGLDSTFNLYRAHATYDVKLVLNFDYGQKAAAQEKTRAQALAAGLSLPFRSIALPWFADFTATALLSGTDLPMGEDVQIESLSRSLETAKNVWVPNRNGIFLNIAAGFAEGLGAQFVVPGFNYEEAQTFPDNSSAFMKALNQAWEFSTASEVRTSCFSIEMNKSEIVAQAVALKVPLRKLWPCYLDGAQWCGQCESCQRFRRALESNGLSFAELQ